MNTCSTCQHWIKAEEDLGDCNSAINGWKIVGSFMVRSDFGCIHHSPKDQMRKNTQIAQKSSETRPTPQEGDDSGQAVTTQGKGVSVQSGGIQAHQGFPPTSEQEVERFWVWMDNRQAQGNLLPDEKYFLNHPHDKIPPKHFIERMRRQTEQ